MSNSYHTYPYRKRLFFITLLLCVFLGFTGAHRFYSGSPAYGKFLLFTLGGFGILWFWDLLLLGGLFRDLKYHAGDGVILV